MNQMFHPVPYTYRKALIFGQACFRCSKNACDCWKVCGVGFVIAKTHRNSRFAHARQKGNLALPIVRLFRSINLVGMLVASMGIEVHHAVLRTWIGLAILNWIAPPNHSKKLHFNVESAIQMFASALGPDPQLPAVRLKIHPAVAVCAQNRAASQYL